MAGSILGALTKWTRRFGRRPAPQSLPEQPRRAHTRIAAGKLGTVLFHGEDEHCKAAIEIIDASSNGVGFWASRPLQVGEPIWITDHEPKPYKATVRHCREDKSGYVMGASRIFHERRRHDRLPTSGAAQLDWSHATKNPGTLDVLVRNVTESGVQVESGRPILPSSVVRIRGQKAIRLGSVCYCIRGGNGARDRFLLGIQLLESDQAAADADKAYL